MSGSRLSMANAATQETIVPVDGWSCKRDDNLGVRDSGAAVYVPGHCLGRASSEDPHSLDMIMSCSMGLTFQ